MSTLEIRDLQVSIDTDAGKKPILKGVDLTINSGEIHAVMGPNGSGKSTLAYTIAGHPRYNVDGGSITFDGEDVLAMSVDERARVGLFLAMQYPVEIPGVTVSNFLRTAKTAVDGEAPVWFVDGTIPLTPGTMALGTMLLSCLTMYWAVDAVGRNDRLNAYLALGLDPGGDVPKAILCTEVRPRLCAFQDGA